MLGYSNIMTLKVQHISETQMKHGIRGIPPAEGCLLLFIFVYAFAPFPSQCCLQGRWVAQTARSLRCGKSCVFRPILSFAFSCLCLFCVSKVLLFLRQRKKGANMEFLNVLH